MIGKQLAPEQRHYLEFQRMLLAEGDNTEPSKDGADIDEAMAYLDPDVVADEDVQQDDFHLSREYRRRITD